MEYKNPLLQQVVAQVEAQVPPELRNTYERIFLAGQKVMYSPETREMMMRQFQSKQNIAEAAGEGIAKLFAILIAESKGTLNMKAAIPAMTALLCDGLDFLEGVGEIQVDESVLAEATSEMGSAILQVLGVTPEKMQGLLAQSGQAQQPQQGPGIVAGAAQEGAMA